MLNGMEARAEERLDDRTAVEVMGWLRGGPDDEFWLLREPPAGLASVFRMPVMRWRPTRDVFCRELLTEELRARGAEVEVEERQDGGEHVHVCTIAAGQRPEPAVSVSAPTPGMALVCAALAYCGQGG